ncbi:porin family protein [Candidatus Palauibacter sp.]|uniref:porin family protein n=1 Tax=Candidatus Palauibacter sp. TaxID=3101350 RepID=UPI003B5BA637
MMRRIVVSLLPLLVAAPLMGQTMVGIRAGLSRSTVSHEAFPDLGLDTHRTGFTAGVDVGLPVSNALEVRVGGAYVQKGLSVEESIGRVGLEMDYLQLSALARVGTSREGPLSLGVLLGPWTAFHLSCDASVSLDIPEFGSINESGSCGDGAKSMDFGIAAGGGAELAVSESLRLALDVVYSIALSDFAEGGGAGKHRNLAVQAGVVIPFGG